MGFIFNQNAGETPETLARKRQIAEALMQQGMDTSPVQHWTQGVARIAQALSGNWARARADREETAGRTAAGKGFSDVMAALMPQPKVPTPTPAAAPAAAPGGTFKKMIQVESGGNPNAVSPKGATGIAQVMPATARDPGFGLPNIFDYARQQGVQVADNSDATLQRLLLDPKINAGFGEAYFNAQKTRYGGDETKAAAAYNAGPGAVDRAGGVPPIKETQDYVQKLGLDGNVQPASYSPQAVQQAAQLPMGKIFELMANPYLTEAQSGILSAVVKDKLATGEWTKLNDGTMFNNKTGETQKVAVPQDPFTLAPGETRFGPGGEKLASVAPKPEKPDYITAKDGSVLKATPGGVEVVYGSKPDPVKPTADIQEYEYAKAQGFKGTFQDFQLAVKKAGASQVNIDQKAEGAFDKKLAENQANSFDAMATDGMNAKADLAVLGELQGLLANKGGTFDGLSASLAKYGLGGEGVSDLQAAQALINKLVPTQRTPGSGSMSDRDVELFTRSLPSLWNTPGGNQKIMSVMMGLAQYRQAQGDIAQQVMTNQITRGEAIARLRALQNPLAMQKPQPVVIQGADGKSYKIEEE